MRDGNSSLQVALTTQRRGSGPRTLGVDHRPCQLDGAETPVPTPDRRGEAALSGSCTDWDQWGDAGRVLPEGEEMFSVNLGALLVIRLDWLRLPLLCRSQHSKTADHFIETKPSKDKKNPAN